MFELIFKFMFTQIYNKKFYKKTLIINNFLFSFIYYYNFYLLYIIFIIINISKRKKREERIH